MEELEYGQKALLPDGKPIRNVLSFPDIHQLRRMDKFKNHPKLKRDYYSKHEVEFLDLFDEHEKGNYFVDNRGWVRKLCWYDEFGNVQAADNLSKALQLYKQFMAVAPSERTLACILGTVASKLNLYSIKTISEFMASNEIDFSSIGKRKTILYLIVDDLSSTYNPLINCLLYQLIQSLVQEAEKNSDNRLQIPVHFYLDDFATYRIPDMDRLIASLRSRGIGMSLILQSETQLNNAYGKNAAKTIINSCDTYRYFGGIDIDTAQSLVYRTNNELKSILELPYGVMYVFQRNEKAKLNSIFPINGLRMDRVIKEHQMLFEDLEKSMINKTGFQSFVEKNQTTMFRRSKSRYNPC